MSKVFQYLLAFVQALITFTGFILISIVIYIETTSLIGKLIAILIALIGLYTSIVVYKLIIKRGFLTAMTGSDAIYELDNLKPIEGGGFIQVRADELAEIFKNKIEKAFTIKIWGDWNGRKLNNKHYISQITYEASEKELNISFHDKCFLKVLNPGIIHVSKSYIKIINADSVIWTVLSANQKEEYYEYTFSDNLIKTNTNTQWKAHKYDLGIGMNAVYLQG